MATGKRNMKLLRTALHTEAGLVLHVEQQPPRLFSSDSGYARPV